MKEFRASGAIGAILDEYEKSVIELKNVLSDITSLELTTIVDPNTKDPDCKSIQTILNHIVGAGYGYVNVIRAFEGEEQKQMKQANLETTTAYQEALDKMFQYNVQLFTDYPKLKLEEYDAEKKILVHWGQRYDVEQLMEHAIVHVLRHRRQIERFLIKLRSE